MLASAILTLTMGVLLPLTALVAMPIVAFSGTREKILVLLVYFSHLLVQVLVVILA